MTQEQFNSTDWHRGNTVRLNNGKEYPVKRVKKSRLLLYSEEYDSFFTADFRIVEERTSDAIDDTPKMPKPQNTAVPTVEAEVAAPKPEPVAEAKPVAASKPESVAASDAKPETPAEAPVKRKRPRIRIVGSAAPQRVDL